MPLNQKGIVHIFLLLLTLAGIGVGLYLVQNPQIFSPKASEVLPASAGEYGSTPLKEAYKYPSTNQTIDLLGFYSFEKAEPGSTRGLTDEKANYLASQMKYVFFDQGSFVIQPGLPEGPYKYENFTSEAQKIKQLNPSVKIGTHAGGAGIIAKFHLIYPYLTDSDFYHDTTNKIIHFTNPQFDYLTLIKPDTGARLINGWRDLFQKNPFIDAVFFDNMQSHHDDPPLAQGCKEGPCNTIESWNQHMISISRQINQLGKEVFYNGLSNFPADNDAYKRVTLGKMNSGFIDYHSGVLAEHVHQMYGDSKAFRNYIEIINEINAKKKKTLFVAMPQLFCPDSVYASPSGCEEYLANKGITMNKDLMRFFLTSYLLIQDKGLTYFSYNPGKPYNGNESIYFYKDWNSNFGQPHASFANFKSLDMYYRVYTNGYAVVNASDNPLEFEFPKGQVFKAWDDSELVSGVITVPAKTGTFFFYQPNATPTPVASIQPGLYGSTPLSELSKYPKRTDGVGIIGTLLFETNSLTTPVMNYIAGEMDYFIFDPSRLSDKLADGRYDFGYFYDFTRRMKTINKNLKIIAGAGGIGILAPYHITNYALAENDFLHTPAGQRIFFEGPQDSHERSYVNLPNAQTRQKIADLWKNILTNFPTIDGILFDSVTSYHQDKYIIEQGCKEENCTTRDFWIPNQIALAKTVKNTIPAGRELFYNGIFDYDNPNWTQISHGTLNSDFINYSDGALSEHPHTIITSNLTFKKYMETINSITAKNKKLFFWVQPQLLSTTNPGFVFTNDLNLQRFYLTSYLLIEKRGLTYFGYHPGAVYDGNLGLYFYKDWNLNYGQPYSTYANFKSLDMYYRAFTNGYAVVNASDKPLEFEFPPGTAWKEWDPINGSVSSGKVTIPAKTGKFYFFSHRL